MSVINKMLRDLDQRQANVASVPDTVGATPVLGSGIRGDVKAHSGNAAGAKGTRRSWVMGFALVLLAIVAAGALWWQSGGVIPVMPTPAPPPATAPVPVPVPVSQPTPAQAAPEQVVQAETPVGEMTLRMESSLSARRAVDALLSTPPPATVTAPVKSDTPPVQERIKPRSPSASAVAGNAPRPVSASSDTTPILHRQQQAGGDALAQAQGLWNAGSHDAALELMQQSIAAAERAAKSSGSAGANPVLLPLVREMARMQLAQARYGAVWEMLTRLEPFLGNQADLWAIRANAAQRLARHPDSVHAYMMALQSRPDEQRWLLGAAVSLAALGQISSASEMAEKARIQGPVSKDILAYLRQAGVTLRD